jgi:alpha-amylase
VTSVVLYFQVHQPWRVRPFSPFELGSRRSPFDDRANARIVRRVAERCYRPANDVLLRLAERHGGRFRCAFSVSGTALDQMERWARPALRSFRDLAATGCVEFLAETSHHSLAFLGDEAEFERQVRDHADRIEGTFGARPTAFRNTELVVDNRVARAAERMGYRVLLAEGAARVLRGRSPRRVYRATGCRRIRYLLRSHDLSDDVAFRFSARGWAEHPVTPEKYARWIHRTADEDVVGLFLDYETFGEHQRAESGIFEFLERMPAEILRDERFRFRTPTEAAAAHEPAGSLDLRRPLSWADTERDLSAWLGNPMQDAAHAALYALLPRVRRAARIDPDLYRDWRRLSSSDHVYYMCTKWLADGDVHAYFSPWRSPHDAHVAFVNVLEDLRHRAEAALRRGRAMSAEVAT